MPRRSFAGTVVRMRCSLADRHVPGIDASTRSRRASTAIARCPTASREAVRARCSMRRPCAAARARSRRRHGPHRLAVRRGRRRLCRRRPLARHAACVRGAVRARAAPGAGRRPSASFRRRDVRRRHADPGVRRDGRLAAIRRRGAARAASGRRRADRPHGRARGRRRRAHEAAARSVILGRGRSEATERARRGREPARRAGDRRRAPHRRHLDGATHAAPVHRASSRRCALLGLAGERQERRDGAARRLGRRATFGSLDAASSESHAFELQMFKFEGAAA